VGEGRGAMHWRGTVGIKQHTAWIRNASEEMRIQAVTFGVLRLDLEAILHAMLVVVV
jgi:hypothetical protein